MATVVWTVGARDDLRDIIEYIERDSPTYAAATAERILRAIENVAEYPEAGRVVPEYDRPSLREVIVRSYRLIYEVTPSRVAVIAIVHGSRDLLRRLRGEPWDLG